MKLWGSRFKKDTNRLVEEFNSSLEFDKELYHYDILGSKTHVKMLAETNNISKSEADKIIEGLDEIKDEIEIEGIENIKIYEDIHTYIESELIEKIGEVGGKLHTARSRNDQIALDMRLFIRDKIFEIDELLIDFLSVLLNIAHDNINTIFPGYTHMQKAQPITFGHHIMAYYFKFKRDLDRWRDNIKRTNIMPLGSCALAGTSFDIDRDWVAEELNFDYISQNSLDGVSDRDYIVEFLSIASNFIIHLSGLSEELILWSNQEYSYIELDDAYTTGSSIMPQKKNPDVAELARGKTGEIFGYLMQCLTILKGLPLAYNKDLQVINESIFKSVNIITTLLKIYPDMLNTMEIKEKNMYDSSKKDYINATELANFLVQKGLTFREAHNISGKIVLYGIENDMELEEFTNEDWNNFIPDLKDKKKIQDILSIQNVVKRSNSKGGPAPAELTRVINEEVKWIDNIISH